jgi:hypothetical protein
VQNAQRFTKEEAEHAAQRWGDWLTAQGYQDSARRICVKPATGGIATGWRYRSG